MTNREAIEILKYNRVLCINSETEPFAIAYDLAIKALDQLPKLQNRCHALTHGLICAFCLYECEHKAEIEPQESEDT